MTPQERDLILSVFDRLGRLAGKEKDAQAEALIHERLRAVPDAAYNLVEAVVVQEMAIKENQERIAQLEAQLAQRQPQQQHQPGGFAQGGQGGGNPWGRGSVPATQQPAQQQQYAQPQPQQYAQPSPWGQPSAGGSFLRTAAGAAVGVAGGMLLGNAISGMFAGGHGSSPWGGGAQHAAGDTTINNYYGGTPQQAADGGASQVNYDTQVADNQDYGSFDSGFDGGGDEVF